MAQRVGRGIALLFHDGGTRRGGKWSAARPGRTLPPGKTWYQFYRRLDGPQGRSGRAGNLVPTVIRSRTVQPVFSRYTDWATRPTTKKDIKTNLEAKTLTKATKVYIFLFVGSSPKSSCPGEQPLVWVCLVSVLVLLLLLFIRRYWSLTFIRFRLQKRARTHTHTRARAHTHTKPQKVWNSAELHL